MKNGSTCELLFLAIIDKKDIFAKIWLITKKLGVGWEKSLNMYLHLQNKGLLMLK